MGRQFLEYIECVLDSEHNEKAVAFPLELEERYLDVKVLARGGMGQIFCAVDRILDKKVAIKVLPASTDEAALVRFQKEAIALSKLHNEHIVTVLNFGLVSERAYLVMEYVEGDTVESMIEASGALPLSQALSIARQVTVALEHAHANSIIHRDLKPSNVMVDSELSVKLLDFGVAKLLSDEMRSTTQLAAGKSSGPVGSPLYMSPEQIDGAAVDERTDIYGLGMLLFSMLAGHAPFEDDNTMELLRKQRHDVPPSLVPHLDAEHGFEVATKVDRTVQQMLRKSKDERFQSMAAVRQALDQLAEEILNQLSKKEQSQTGFSAAPRQLIARHRRALAVAVGVLLCGLGTLCLLNLQMLIGNAKTTFGLTSSDADKIQRRASALAEKEINKFDKYPDSNKIERADLPQISEPFTFSDDEYDRGVWCASSTCSDQDLKTLVSKPIYNLRLDENPYVTDEGIKNLVGLPLVGISLENTKITDGALVYLAKIKTLRLIRLDRTAITDDGLKALLPLRKTLGKLKIGTRSGGLTIKGLRYLSENFVGLVDLDIGDSSFPVSSLSCLKKLPNLKYLTVSSMNVNDDNVKTLAQLNVRELDLSCTAITDKSIPVLIGMHSLKHVFLNGCPGITDKGLVELGRERRDIDINWQGIGADLTGLIEKD